MRLLVITDLKAGASTWFGLKSIADYPKTVAIIMDC